MTASEDRRDDPAAVAGTTTAGTETFGLLLVHGIGSQRRGDTLVQCTTALHGWMRTWLEQGELKHGEWCERPFGPDLIETSIAEAGPDHPPQTTIVFRRGKELDKVSWLIAESCWFDTYRRPGFYEFMQWALAVIPVAIVVHFAIPYRRMWRPLDALNQAAQWGEKARKAGFLPKQAFIHLKRELGPDAAHKTRQELAQGPEIEGVQWSLTRRMIGMQIKLAVVVIAGIVAQLLLATVALLTILPGITRSFAAWVQRKLSATIGDSFMFVTSPITGAAILTRVKKDLEWLAARCDRVIVLAHSQGAAVSYNVIRRQSWGGNSPEKLHALVTYGSGLRKLHDLEKNLKFTRFWIGIGAVSNVMALVIATLIALLLIGVIPWWAGVLGLLAGVVLQMGPLLWPIAILRDPGALPIAWYDYYASHDPVPNGPTEVVPEWAEDWPNVNTTTLTDSHVMAFEERQREVVNWRSTLSDHSSYWSSHDDFVGRIIGILADASGVMMYFPLDAAWLQVSRDRRAWRVAWLSRCRAVAGLACLAIVLWPRSMLEPAEIRMRELVEAISAYAPKTLSVWIASAMHLPDQFLGAAGLALATYLIFAMALAGWTVWEKQEVGRFFRREPHGSIGAGGWIFALAWIGFLFLPPAYSLTHPIHSDWHALLGVLWAPITLAIWSAWKVHRSGPAPGTPHAWGCIALACAENAMANQEQDRRVALYEAKTCFTRSRDCLGIGSDEWVRAVVGETRAVEELTTIEEQSAIRAQARDIYKKAIDALKRARRDSSEVESRLERVPPTWPIPSDQQIHGCRAD